MTLKPESPSQARTRTRTRIRTCRLSPCYRHPDEPVTGICASCLRERLSGLDSSAADIAASFSPELRRCRSVSTSKCEASCSSFTEQRRKSCDVRSDRSSLAHLFDDDDEKNGSGGCSKVESKNLGLSRVTYTVIESSEENRCSEEIWVSRNALVAVDVEAIDDHVEVDEGEFKTMKEYIDLEFQNKNNKSKDIKGIAGNLLGAASVFTKKLQKWRQKNKMKKANNSSSSNCETAGSHCCNDVVSNREKSREAPSEIGGRRSCDTEPRFSVDAGRISFDEPRASWDGYMIARTIPRLAPMFSVVENGILGNANRFENRRLSVDGPMHSIMEDETSSGGSGYSNSDSSSMMRSSFDRSSSVRSFGKKIMGSEDQMVSPANLKLVITERELKDWHMNSIKDDDLEKVGSISKRTAAIENVGNMNVPKKTVRWHKVRNAISFKHKNCEDKCESFTRNVIDSSIDDPKQGEDASGEVKEVSGWKLARSSSVVGLRNSGEIQGSSYGRRSVDNSGLRAYKGREEFMLERNMSAKYSSMDLDNGIVPFYMTPLRSLRSIKGGKFKL
ncbi:unnamed protein product [Fraxinus pennsylvanica]|uniref:Uncharacterized protein n=1 Tax=Fraxinus pennsylvanica TaxID=56036 RepID=A0AAD2DP03_9LAMI|nr:unnamed protein product [Fraxinus pennsylvanica]